MKLINPQPGNVMIQAKTISFTIPQFTEDILLAAPTPIMAVVLVCVVLTGSPSNEARSKHNAPAKSAEKP